MSMFGQTVFAGAIQSTGAVPPTLAVIDGQSVNVSGIEDAVGRVFDRLAYPSSFFVCTLNLDHLVKRRRDPDFRKAYGKAEIVTVDGFPVAALARLTGASISRATGSDLVLPLCCEAAARKSRVFLIGATLQALCATARRLVAAHPELEICGVYAPPNGFDAYSEVADEAIAVIRESGAQICFVALGAPRQEIFSARAIKETNNVAFVAVGGGIDFLAGTQIRCPALIRRFYLEWAWRLMLNPRRLGPRYLRCAMLLLVLLVQTGIPTNRGRGLSIRKRS
ncbi:N-acetylglucosaminyldiphosphoundecaprenol N-acetyl-beta-D-mannosaminyltransferase [Bradyrhizobium sp. USDA 4449]